MPRLNSFTGRTLTATGVNTASTSALITLDNPNPNTLNDADYFGQSVGVSDSYVIVGASREDTGGTENNVGQAYIYDLSGTLLRTLSNPALTDPANDDFSISVAISESYAIVGARNATGNGAAYIFDTSTGNLLHTLTNPNANGSFGYRVAISDSYAVVGDYTTRGTFIGSGALHVYDPSTGNRQYSVTNPNDYGADSQDYFSTSIGISDSYIIAGAPDEDRDGATSVGKAYIFDITDGSLLHTLDNPSPDATDQFGDTVSISENYAVVGAHGDDADGGNSGRVYIFDPSTGSLIRTLTNPNAYDTAAADNFGWDVATNGTYTVVTAPYEDTATGSDEGKLYVFANSTGDLINTIDAPAGSLFFGRGIVSRGIAVSNTSIAISGFWNQKAYIASIT